MYDDNYETCERTYVTLRIYPAKSSIEEITKLLGIDPSFVQDNESSEALSKKGWFFSTKGHVNSKDARRHIDFLLDQLLPKKDQLKALEQENAQIDFVCFWQSLAGNGGPTLSAQQLQKLAELGIEIWFDLY